MLVGIGKLSNSLFFKNSKALSMRNFSIFFNTLNDRSISLLVLGIYTFLSVKYQIQAKEGLTTEVFEMAFEGKILHNLECIFVYNIYRYSTLNVITRLCGGAMGKGASSSLNPSFTDSINNRSCIPHTQVHVPESYVVEKSKHTPHLEMNNPTIEGIHLAYSSRAIVCRFNGF